MTKARRPGRGTPRRRPPLPSWLRTTGSTIEDDDGVDVEVRFLQPHQATKPYVCPGCHTTIPPGTGHVVVVPVGAAEDRRHWHRSCWQQRRSRR